MKFSFDAKIYKVGINPCVDVPLHITGKMIPEKGYIPVKGKIKICFSLRSTESYLILLFVIIQQRTCKRKSYC